MKTRFLREENSKFSIKLKKKKIREFLLKNLESVLLHFSKKKKKLYENKKIRCLPICFFSFHFVPSFFQYNLYWKCRQKKIFKIKEKVTGQF